MFPVSKHELNVIMDEIIERHENDIDAIIKLVLINHIIIYLFIQIHKECLKKLMK